MDLHLNDAQVEELRSLLDSALADLSHEIASTDNAFFRDGLRTRREHLRAIRTELSNAP